MRAADTPPIAQPIHGSTRRTVLLVEDHPITRRGLAALINRQSDLTICGEADDVDSAVALANELSPNIAVVDAMLKTGSGLDLVKCLTRVCPNTPALMVSMYEESFYAERALRSGAKGYVMKSQPIETILGAIREVLAGGIFLSEKLRHRNAVIQARNSGEQMALSNTRLSIYEVQVFRLLGQGYSSRIVAEVLQLSTAEVNFHRERLKEKLLLESGAELVPYAVQWRQSAAYPDRSYQGAVPGLRPI